MSQISHLYDCDSDEEDDYNDFMDLVMCMNSYL